MGTAEAMWQGSSLVLNKEKCIALDKFDFGGAAETLCFNLNVCVITIYGWMAWNVITTQLHTLRQ